MQWPTVLRSSGYRSTPWRNGAGTTREVAAEAATDGAGFRWRVSIAQVADSGPFSDFPGVDRIIVPLDTAGLHLTVDGAQQPVSQFEPFAFPGEAATAARLSTGSTRDLNVMWRRDICRASVEIVETDKPWAIPPATSQARLCVMLFATATVTDTALTAQTVALDELDAVFLPASGTVEPVGDRMVAAVIVVF